MVGDLNDLVPNITNETRLNYYYVATNFTCFYIFVAKLSPSPSSIGD